MPSPSPEKVVVDCEHCGAKLRLDAKYQGKTIKCPKCSGPVTVAATPLAPAPPRPVRGAAGSGRGGKVETRRHRYDGGADANRPMVNRAPTVAADDPFSRDAVSGGRGRGVSGPGARRPTARSGRTERRGGGGTSRGRDERRPGARGDSRGGRGPSRSGASQGLSPKQINLLILIGAGVLSVGIIIALVVTADRDRTPPDAVASGDPTTEDVVDTPPTPPHEELREEWQKAGRDLERRMRTLSNFSGARAENEALARLWADYFIEVREAIVAEYSSSMLTEREQLRGWQNSAQWARGVNEDEAMRAFAKRGLDINPNHEAIRRILGHERWRLPTEDDDIEEASTRGWIEDFVELSNQWFDAEERAKLDADLERAMGPIRERLRNWERDPFLRWAYQAERSVTEDIVLREFESDFAVRIVRPFVVIFGTDGSIGSREIDNRYELFKDVLEPFWEMWVDLVQLNEFQSKKNDTPETPQPYLWLSMATRQGFQEYMERTNQNIPDFARAFYKPMTECVYFWEGEGLVEDLPVVLHETLHQVMERYTSVHDSIFGFYNLAFTEGTAEYYSGFDRSGPNDSIRFGKWTHEDRIRSMTRHREVLNRNVGVFEWNITNDDWVALQVPALLTQPQWMVFNWTGRYMQQRLANSPYNTSPAAVFEIPQRAIGALYAFGWAWVYFLNEYYPQQYNRYMRELMNEGNTDAEAFLDAFDIAWDREEFPDLQATIGRDLGEALRNPDRQQQIFHTYWDRINWLKANPTIQRINQEFVDFLKQRVPERRESGGEENGNAQNGNGADNGNGDRAERWWIDDPLRSYRETRAADEARFAGDGDEPREQRPEARFRLPSILR